MNRVVYRSSLVVILFVLAGNHGLAQKIDESEQASQAKPLLAESRAGMGIMVGEVTNNSAMVQVRLTSGRRDSDGDWTGLPGVVLFVVRAAGEDASQSRGRVVEAQAEYDFIARAVIEGLEPGRKYICETMIGPDPKSVRPGPIATFRTLPGKELSRDVSFVVVTGMNYAKFHGDQRIDREKHVVQNNTELPPAYQGTDKQLGYPALASILAIEPDFFVGTGDNVYYDTPVKGRAESLAELRQKWHQQFVQPRYRNLFARVPTYWQIDDHDYRVDDCDNSGDYEPSPQLAQRLMNEQLPFAPHGAPDLKTYRTHRVSKELQIWITEGRIYRSPNSAPDGPDKSIWGVEQREWLKRTLKESDATFKLLISATPMVGPDDLRKTDNHTNVGGFQHERDEFFGWLKREGILDQHFYIICGDRHWQYHSIHPSGVEEFSSGALVDANSRLGRKPGDPKSTDPEGLIQQPYYQDPASGGFLHVSVQPSAGDGQSVLKFSYRDEHGKILHECTKQSN